MLMTDKIISIFAISYTLFKKCYSQSVIHPDILTEAQSAKLLVLNNDVF